jgi:hypothetical protein
MVTRQLYVKRSQLIMGMAMHLNVHVVMSSIVNVVLSLFGDVDCMADVVS